MGDGPARRGRRRAQLRARRLGRRALRAQSGEPRPGVVARVEPVVTVRQCGHACELRGVAGAGYDAWDLDPASQDSTAAFTEDGNGRSPDLGGPHSRSALAGCGSRASGGFPGASSRRRRNRTTGPTRGWACRPRRPAWCTAKKGARRGRRAGGRDHPRPVPGDPRAQRVARRVVREAVARGRCAGVTAAERRERRARRALSAAQRRRRMAA